VGRLVLDLGVAPLAYYGLAAAGAETSNALLAATAVAGVWLVGTTVVDRRVDGLAAFMLGMYAVMFLLAVAASDERMLLARDPLTSALGGLVFLGSCASPVPATAYLAHKLHGKPLHDPGLHRAHIVESLVVGLGLTVEAVVRLALVFNLPVTVTAGLAPAIEFAVLPVLLGWLAWHRVRATRRARESQEGAPEPGPMPESVPASSPAGRP